MKESTLLRNQKEIEGYNCLKKTQHSTPKNAIADTGEEIIILTTTLRVMILINKIKIKWLSIYMQNNVKIFLVSCGAASINIVTRFTLYNNINKAEEALHRLLI